MNKLFIFGLLVAGVSAEAEGVGYQNLLRCHGANHEINIFVNLASLGYPKAPQFTVNDLVANSGLTPKFETFALQRAALNVSSLSPFQASYSFVGKSLKRDRIITFSIPSLATNNDSGSLNRKLPAKLVLSGDLNRSFDCTQDLATSSFNHMTFKDVLFSDIDLSENYGKGDF